MYVCMYVCMYVYIYIYIDIYIYLQPDEDLWISNLPDDGAQARVVSSSLASTQCPVVLRPCLRASDSKGVISAVPRKGIRKGGPDKWSLTK